MPLKRYSKEDLQKILEVFDDIGDFFTDLFDRIASLFKEKEKKE